MDTLTLKRHAFFQNENEIKATQISSPRPLIFKLQQEVLKLKINVLRKSVFLHNSNFQVNT